MVFILSQTKLSSKTIFVVDKNDTIASLKELITRKMQFNDYIEVFLGIITINCN